MRARVPPAFLAGMLMAVTVPWVGAPTAAAATTAGGLAVTAVDVAGTVLIGTCYELWTDAGGGRRGTLVTDGARCDQPAGSESRFGSPDGYLDGTATWTGLRAGTYVVHEVLPPALAGTAWSYALATDAAVTVPGGGVGRLELAHALTGGLTIRISDAAGAPLPGSCFSATWTGDRLARPATLCDGPVASPGGATGDGQPDGLLLIGGLTPSLRVRDYRLEEVRAPDGYVAVAQQLVKADPATSTEIRIGHPTDGTGGLAVSVTDPAGTGLVSACFELWTDAGDGTRDELVTGSQRCDVGPTTTIKAGQPDGLRNGTTAWTGLEARGYVVHEIFPPALPGTSATYELGPDVAIRVFRDAVAAATVVHRPTAGLTLHKIDPAGRPLPGSCFRVSRRSGLSTTSIVRCDGESPPGSGFTGDAKADGLLLFTGLAPTGTVTTWTLAEVRAPAGYQPAADQPIEADPATPTELTIRNGTGKALGGLAVAAVDEAGTSLVGTCYELWSDAGGGRRGELVAGTTRCDQPSTSRTTRGTPDGLLDGTVAWTGIAPGPYVIHETFPPALAGGAAIYELAADVTVTVRVDTVARSEIVHRLLGGLTIHKTDSAGRPLLGACFSVVAVNDRLAHATALCDGPGAPASGLPGDGIPDGLILFGGLTPTLRPTEYKVREVRAPNGYAPVAELRATADPAAPTVLTIPNGTGGDAGGTTGVTGLELEISSTIEIRALNSLPVGSGEATATGRIPLTGSAAGGWRGRGSLASLTRSKAAACPSIQVSGDGTYDWVVLGAHAGPDIDPGSFTVDMDSGPTSESPDTFSMDACSGTPIEGTMNTWENVWFNVYGTTKRGGGAMGFRVDGWKLIDGGAAWTTGGLVAEAAWSADCATTYLYDCTDHTTFRLYATIGETVPAATPGATEGPGGATATGQPGASDAGGTTASATPAASGVAGGGGPVVECGEACAGLPLLPIALGGGVAILGAALLFLRLMGRNQVVKVEGPDLNGSANDVPIEPLDLDKTAPLENIDATIAGGWIKLVDPSIVDLSKVEPLDPDLWKLPGLDAELYKLDPATQDVYKLDPATADLYKLDPTTVDLSKVEPLPGDGPLLDANLPPPPTP